MLHSLQQRLATDNLSYINIIYYLSCIFINEYVICGLSGHCFGFEEATTSHEVGFSLDVKRLELIATV